MIDQLSLVLVGVLASAAAALATWALRQVHAMSIEVAVLRRGEGAVGLELRDLKAALGRHEETAREAMVALEGRLGARLDRIEARLEALAVRLDSRDAADGVRPRDAADGVRARAR